MEITFLPTDTSKIHLHVEQSYRTPAEHWQKTSDLPKGKKLPTYLGRAKEKRKNRDKRIGMGLAPLGRSSRLNLHNQLDVPCISGIPE